MEKIKVLRIIARMNIGGPAIQAVLLTAGLNKDRFDSILIAGSVGEKEGDMNYLASENGIEPLSVPELRRELNFLNDIISFYKIYKFIKREKPDVVHTHTAKAGTIGRLAAKLAGTSLIAHTFHGHIFHGYFSPLKTKFFLLIERILANITDKIVVISERQKSEIKRYLHMDSEDKLALIPLGFNLVEFLEDDDKADTVHTELNIPKEALVIGIVGRLTAVKNHKMFLAAAKEIKERIPEKTVKFLIIGDGELKDELVVLSEKLDIRRDVIFTGWKKKLASLYHTIDIIGLTSLNEGTPVSLIEALASARPVVATDVGGVRDVVENNKSGFIVPSNDVNAFTEAVSTLVADEERRKRFGLHGRDFVKDRYHKDKLILAIERLYCRELRKKKINYEKD